MPNGKGTLDCAYCTHFTSSGAAPAFHEEGWCFFHELRIPACDNNRICYQFHANQAYFVDNVKYEREGGVWYQISPIERFSWFDKPIEPGILYEFPYPNCKVVPFIQLNHSADANNPRRRVEMALLKEQPFDAVWELMKTFKAEGIPKRNVQQILIDYAHLLSGDLGRHRALLKVLAILAGQQPAPEEGMTT